MNKKKERFPDEVIPDHVSDVDEDLLLNKSGSEHEDESSEEDISGHPTFQPENSNTGDKDCVIDAETDVLIQRFYLHLISPNGGRNICQKR